MNQRWDAIYSGEREHTGRWVSLPDNGWGAMLAYLAGPRWVRSRPLHRSSVKVMVEGQDGSVVRFEEPLSDRDREIVYSRPQWSTWPMRASLRHRATWAGSWRSRRPSAQQSSGVSCTKRRARPSMLRTEMLKRRQRAPCPLCG